MNTKALFSMIVVLVVLVVVFLFTRGDREDTRTDEATAAFAAFRSLDTASVDRITIERDGVQAEVVRTGSGDEATWELKSSFGYPADPDRIERLYEELEKIEEGEVAGTSPASHSNFEVDAKKGARVSFFQGEKALASITLGKRAPTRTMDSYSYVRFGDDAEVYRVDGEARSFVGAGGDELDKDYVLRKELFELGENQKVIQAKIVYPDHSLLINRRYVEKVIEEPGEANSEEEGESSGGKIAVEEPEKEKKTEKVEEFHVTSGSETFKVVKDKEWDAKSYLNNHKSLRVKAAVEPTELSKYGLDKPQLRVELKAVDEGNGDIETTVVLFGNAIKDEKSGEDTGYYVTLEGVTPPRIYTIEKYTISSWKKEMADFKPKPPEPEKEEGEEPGIVGDGEPGPGAKGEAGTGAPGEKPPGDTGHAHAGKVRARHILIPFQGSDSADDSVTRTKEEARKEAERLVAEARKEGADFASLAREHSSCPSSSEGGDLGEFSYPQMVQPFSEAAFHLEPGEVSDVVETGFGFHVIQRVE